MKTLKFRRSFFVVLFVLITSSILYATGGLQLGSMSLSYSPAPTLRTSTSLSTALRSSSFVGSVGGIAFDKIAKPEDNLNVMNFSIRYNSTRPDGNRLQIFINNKEVAADIYDWQLVPIAKYANSPFFSVFTLFGELNDENKKRQILDGEGRILNYNPEFVNTLMGLRLFQLDILVFMQNATELPQMNGQYVLGAGESAPNVSSNLQSFRKTIEYISSLSGNKGSQQHRSYVICDVEQDIRFNVRNGSLIITGQPFYYAWKYKGDDPGYNQDSARTMISNRIKQELKNAKLTNSQLSEKTWYTDQVMQEISTVNLPEDVKGEFLVELMTGNIQTEEVRFILEELRLVQDKQEVVYLKEYSRQLSSKTDLLRSINPAVWDAGVMTMRYAAFFRYCKQNFADEWDIFMRQIKRVQIKPDVETPTVLQK